MNQELLYEAGTRSASEIRDLTAKMIDEVKEDPDLRAEITSYGIDPSELSPDSIDVRPEGAGLDPVIASLIIAFVAPPVIDVWRHILLPRLRRRFGSDVVGEEKESDG